MPDPLDESGAEGSAGLRDGFVTRLAVVHHHTDLDQFVVRKRELDLAQHGVGQASVAGLHDHAARVGESAQVLLLRLGQCGCGHGRKDTAVKKRSSSSKRWLTEHFSDEFVKRAQQLGLRSRAAFKLEEIDQRDRLLRPGAVVVDLGAAPGGWSQYAAKRLAGKGRVIAIDILPMAPLPGVEFVQADFTAADAPARLHQLLAGAPVDLVISDMSPNISGEADVDQARGIHLSELAVEFAMQVLRPGGSLLMKAFRAQVTRGW